MKILQPSPRPGPVLKAMRRSDTIEDTFESTIVIETSLLHSLGNAFSSGIPDFGVLF